MTEFGSEQRLPADYISPDIPWESLPARFMRMRDYLDEKAAGKAMPGRSDIDPLDIPALLAWINILDVDAGGEELSFRFRLVGTRFVEAAGFDPTGRLVSDVLNGHFSAPAWKMSGQVVRERRPLFGRFPLRVEGREFIDCMRVQFPLSDDGETVDQIITIHHFPDPQPGPSRPA